MSLLSELGEDEVERALRPEEAKDELLRERALRRRPRALVVCEVVGPSAGGIAYRP